MLEIAWLSWEVGQTEKVRKSLEEMRRLEELAQALELHVHAGPHADLGAGDREELADAAKTRHLRKHLPRDNCETNM